MTAYAPQIHLETHDVTNAPPPFGARNFYEDDRALGEAARLFGGEWVEPPLSALGAAAGSEEAQSWGEDANRYTPELADLRPLRAAHRRGEIPPRLSQPHGARDGASHPQHRLARDAAGPACRARGAAGAGDRGRGGHHVSHQHDLCERRGAAPSARRGRDLGGEGHRGRVRRAAAAHRGQARRDHRHGHDGKAGRLRRARQHDARLSAGRGRTRRRLPAHRPQMVLLRADVRRLPHARLHGQGPQLLPRPAHQARRAAQRHPCAAAEGQARQQIERLLRDRISRRLCPDDRRGRRAASRRSSRWCITRGSTPWRARSA